MLDAIPVLVKRAVFLKVGIVVQIVALQAALFSFIKRQSHAKAKLCDLLIGKITFAVLSRDMRRTWSMAILATVSMKMLGLVEVYVA